MSADCWCACQSDRWTRFCSNSRLPESVCSLSWRKWNVSARLLIILLHKNAASIRLLLPRLMDDELWILKKDLTNLFCPPPEELLPALYVSTLLQCQKNRLPRSALPVTEISLKRLPLYPICHPYLTFYIKISTSTALKNYDEIFLNCA